MNKTMWTMAVLLATFILFKAEKEAYPNTYDTEHTDMWRSSVTCGRVNFALISTGTVFAHAVIIGSPTVNTESFFSIYNSSSAATMTGSVSNLNIDTAAFTGTNSHQSSSMPPGHKVEFNIPLSSGAVINAEGLACRTFLWDFFPSKFPYYWVPFRP